jgi:P27 family predicted phage terminase small subunit
MGRKPKPTALKLLRGNPGKRPLNKFEPKPEDTPPECPEHLSQLAKEEWAFKMDELPAGLITKLDKAVFAGYCHYWAEWVILKESVQRMGRVIETTHGNLIPNPSFSMGNTVYKLMLASATECGFSPSSRTRISVEPKKKPKTDQWEGFGG